VTIGVLALQGDYEAHVRAVERAGARAVEVRTARELGAVDGLIIPGGESSTMLKLLDREGMFDALREFGATKPLFGTCAGAILMASAVTNPVQASLGLIDMTVERNAYGRQLDSRVVRLEDGVEAVFIRAPIIRETRGDVKILATYNGDPVWVEQGRHVAATFHPELSGDTRIHEYFIRKVAA
jgi:pyridoxal 5'-phosphate synthase pdxT subunit